MESSTHRNLAEDQDTVELEKGNRELTPVDSTFIIVDDLTADGEADSVELRVLGPRVADPFSWTVRIWVRGKLVFQHEAVDSLVDRIFGGPGTHSGAEVFGLTGNRGEDKAFYYFESLPKRIIDRAQFDAEHAIFDRDSPSGVHRTLARELKGRGLANEQTVEAITERIVTELRSGTVLISIPVNPFISQFPLIYIEELGEFVPVFVW